MRKMCEGIDTNVASSKEGEGKRRRAGWPRSGADPGGVHLDAGAGVYFVIQS